MLGLLVAVPSRAEEPDDLYDVADLRRLQETFAALAERVEPTVVAIRTYRSVTADDSTRPDIPVRIAENQGSGVILRSDGLVLTNEHVVGRSDRIEVVLHDGEFYDAKLVQADPRSDLAVIRIDAERTLMPARLGDISQVRPGYWSFTVGNPFGLANEDGETAFSVGNITALGKSLTPRLDPTGVRYYGNLVLTSSPINPGNSGGPLFNLEGDVIGISTAMLSSSGANEGLGFAIPISERTKRIIATLSRGDPVRYGFLGVKIVTPDRRQRERAGVPRTGGALIRSVTGAQSPASRAGLRPGDVIVEFDGVAIEDSDHLVRVVGGTPVSAIVEVVYYRAGERKLTRVKLAERPPQVAFLPQVPSRTQTWWWGRVLLGEPTESALSAHGLSPEDAGLVVILVEPSDSWYERGLRAENIIVRVNGRRVRTLAEFKRLVGAASTARSLTLSNGRKLSAAR